MLTIDIVYVFLYTCLTCISVAFAFFLAVVAISAVVERVRRKYAKK